MHCFFEIDLVVNKFSEQLVQVTIDSVPINLIEEFDSQDPAQFYIMAYLWVGATGGPFLIHPNH